MSENINMQIWDKVKRPPKTALKNITGGRLNGKTDISPQWRLQALTETFGACGIGWKYAVNKIDFVPGSEGQMFCFADISLFVKQSGTWSEPIPGHGGSMLLELQRGGLFHNDDAQKMAITDALSVACKALGIAADIYLGMFDGSKYKDEIGKPEPGFTPDNDIVAMFDAIKDLDGLKKAWSGLYPEIREQYQYLKEITMKRIRG